MSLPLSRLVRPNPDDKQLVQRLFLEYEASAEHDQE